MNYKDPAFKSALEDAVKSVLDEQQPNSKNMKAGVPTEFITFDQLRVAEFGEISDLLLMPVQGTNETVVFRVSDIGKFIAPAASNTVAGITKLSSATDSDSEIAAATPYAVYLVSQAISNVSDAAYLKTGGNITGDCSADNLTSRGRVSATGSLEGASSSVNGTASAGLVKSRADVVAYDSSAAPSTMYKKLSRVIGSDAVESLGTMDMLEIIATKFDDLTVQLKRGGVPVK